MDDERMNSLELAAVSNAEGALARVGKSWETDWVPIGQGFLAGRSFCMRINHTNAPRGSGYNKSYGAWLSHHPALQAVNEVVRKSLLDCMENIVEIAEWRERLSLQGAIAWNSPRDVWKNFQAHKKATPVRPDNGSQKTPRTKDDVIMEMQGKIDAYEKTSAGDVVLSKHSSARDNANVIVHSFAEPKLRELVKLILVDRDLPTETERQLREEARATARASRAQ